MALTPEQIGRISRPYGESSIQGFDHILTFSQAIEAEVRKSDEALILQLVEALENSHATLWEEDDDPSRPVHAAIAAARARLLEADLAKLTERGAVAWKGIDPQDLRDGGKQ